MSRSDKDWPDPSEEWGKAVGAAADSLTFAVRLGLASAMLPAKALPHSWRKGLAEALHTTVEATAVLPHAFFKGISDYADELAGDQTGYEKETRTGTDDELADTAEA